MSRFFNFLLGSIFGGIVGAVVVLLLTPYSGSDLRTRGLNYIENMKSEVAHARQSRRQEMRIELETLRGEEPKK